jgi:hypothetical protein
MWTPQHSLSLKHFLGSILGILYLIFPGTGYLPAVNVNFVRSHFAYLGVETLVDLSASDTIMYSETSC